MKTQFTPGPWVARGLESRCPYICADEGKMWDNPEICNLFNDVTPVDSVSGQWLEPLPNAVANARLIAAAPDLLACLIDAVKALEFAAPIIEAPEKSAYRETVAEALAAIAKATGSAK